MPLISDRVISDRAARIVKTTKTVYSQISIETGPADLDSESKRLPRILKLNNAKDFQRVFDQACYKSHDKLFVMLALKNESGCARLGMTVAKKNIAKSVARSRIKRLIRESFRQHKKLPGNLDIIVIVKRGADKKNNREISTSLYNHWLKLAQQNS